MSSETKKAANNLQNFALFFFAVVGFIASLTTISAFFRSDSQTELTVKANAYRLSTPKYVARYFETGSSARNNAADVRDALCKDMDSNDLIGLGDDELLAVKVQGKTESQIRRCRDAHALEFAARWLNGFSQQSGTLFQYDITNTGSEVAKLIRLDADLVNAVDLQRGDVISEVKKKPGGEFYELPDLNPNDNMKISIYSNRNLFLHEGLIYSSADMFPALTHSGSRTFLSIYKPVSGIWRDAAEFFEDMPWIIAAVFILAISLLVSGVTILIVSISVSLAKGEGVSGAFKSNKLVESPPNAAEAD